MANHSSACVREQTPHLSAAIKRHAQSLANDKSIDGPSRTIIRYGLEINDPSLGELVRRLDAGETITDNAFVTPPRGRQGGKATDGPMAEVVWAGDA